MAVLTVSLFLVEFNIFLRFSVEDSWPLREGSTFILREPKRGPPRWTPYSLSSHAETSYSYIHSVLEPNRCSGTGRLLWRIAQPTTSINAPAISHPTIPRS